MHVHFWGTRGSLPAPINAHDIRRKLRRALETALERGLSPGDDLDSFMDRELPFSIRAAYGADTPCVQVGDRSSFLICDAGSGIRELGNHLVRDAKCPAPTEYHLLISHPQVRRPAQA